MGEGQLINTVQSRREDTQLSTSNARADSALADIDQALTTMGLGKLINRKEIV